MKIDGIQLAQGSNISNLVVASGTSFPSTPDEGEMFFRTDAAVNVKGLYAYIGGSWDRIASTDSLTAPNGAVLPSVASAGDLFYLNTNDVAEGLYAYSGSAWVMVSGSGSAPSYTISGDVTGTIDGGTDALTLATVNSNVGSFGSATAIPVLTVNAKGLVTAVSTQNVNTSFTITGDVTGTVDGGTDVLTLATVATPGTFKSVTVNAKGLVTAGTNPTTLAGYGITDALTTAQLGAASGVASLDGNGKLAFAQVPAIAITDTFVVASQVAQVALTAEVGDVAVRTDLNKSFILRAEPASTFSNWQELLTPTDTVTSVNGQTGAVTLTATDITSGTFADARISQASVTQHQAALTILESQITDGSLLARVGGNETITGTWSFSNPTTVATPTTAGHAATKSYVDTTVAAAAGGSAPITVVTGTAQTAVKGNHYVLTNGTSTSTVTLPASPVKDDTVIVSNFTGLVTATVARNTARIQSLAEDLVIDVLGASVTLKYADTTRGWVLI